MHNTNRPKDAHTAWMWRQRVGAVQTRVRAWIAGWWSTRRQPVPQPVMHTPSQHVRLDHAAMLTRHAHWCAFLEAKRIEVELRRAAHGIGDDWEARDEP
jgi:hypothetical protein